MMDWQTCCLKKIVKEVGLDEELINSLITSSERKLISSEELKLSEITAVSKISLAYDSLRELLEALALKKGYKVYNHECFVSFLKEIVENSNWGDEFDSLRVLRNSLNYYGKDVDLKNVPGILEKLGNLRESILEVMK